MVDYKSLKQKYTLYARPVSVLFCAPLIVLLYARGNTGVILCGFACLLAAMLGIYFLNKWYYKQLDELLFERMDMNSWEQFIQINSVNRFSKGRLQAEFAAVSYAYMTGDFSRVVKEGQTLIDKTN